jgi:hypothetical protein
VRPSAVDKVKQAIKTFVCRCWIREISALNTLGVLTDM